MSYLLPSGTGGMEQFYPQVLRRLRERFARDGLVDANSTISDVFRVLVGRGDLGRGVQRSASSKSPEQAVSFLRERVKAEVKKFLRAASPGEQPILPRLHDLLIEAAGHGTGTTIDQDYLDDFRARLVGLLPRTSRRRAAAR